MAQSICIYEDGQWTGNGRLSGGKIENCIAVLGWKHDLREAAIAEIEEAIARGQVTATLEGYVWTWDIED